MPEAQPHQPYSDSHGGVLFLANRADLTSLNYFVANPDLPEEDFVCAVAVILARCAAARASQTPVKYRVIREYCDHALMVRDHMSGVLSYNLDYPDNYADSSSDSGFENTNLVDMHRINVPYYGEEPKRIHTLDEFVNFVAFGDTNEAAFNFVDDPEETEYPLVQLPVKRPDALKDGLGLKIDPYELAWLEFLAVLVAFKERRLGAGGHVLAKK